MLSSLFKQEGLSASDSTHDATVTIRVPDKACFSRLQAIELAAFETLRAAGAVTGPASASSLEALTRYHTCGHLLAAFTPQGEACGFIGGELTNNWLHIAEMDVHPAWQRKGIGRRLVERQLALARQKALVGVSLTTDRLAAFNAPFYASLGFKQVGEQDGPAHLQSILKAERSSGFNAARRVAMIYDC